MKNNEEIEILEENNLDNKYICTCGKKLDPKWSYCPNCKKQINIKNKKNNEQIINKLFPIIYGIIILILLFYGKISLAFLAGIIAVINAIINSKTNSSETIVYWAAIGIGALYLSFNLMLFGSCFNIVDNESNNSDFFETMRGCE